MLNVIFDALFGERDSDECPHCDKGYTSCSGTNYKCTYCDGTGRKGDRHDSLPPEPEPGDKDHYTRDLEREWKPRPFV